MYPCVVYANFSPGLFTSGDSLIAASMFLGEMFFPPAVMMISFLRPVMERNPSASMDPMSPLCSQPSASTASRVASGLFR